MNALVVYDSQYGNTERLAEAIGEALAPCGVVRVSKVTPEQLTGLDVLVVGSPTQRFRPTPAVSAFLASVPAAGLRGVRVAAFDTRFSAQRARSMSAVLGFVVRLLGPSAYAATHLAKQLEQRGGTLIAPPEGFRVTDAEGPLEEGELERAASWGAKLRLAPEPLGPRHDHVVPGPGGGKAQARSQHSGRG
ncbi:MAG: flavodoxin domain-containing protein [Truepera sp.]|jgi:flavodoxin|nr:flavodoxin domain-containing protein [Truepera sp.]HRN19546.1 flavodoxin domain-containing protein [Trueperaceae bacterium]HRQ11233.1 flavodoxin domain-containing protein [Trueperaceae bacterium]